MTLARAAAALVGAVVSPWALAAVQVEDVAPSPEGVQRLLVHDDLRSEPVRLLAIRGGEGAEDGDVLVSFINADGIQRTLPARELAAITHPDGEAWWPLAIVRRSTPGRPAEPQTLELTNGERYVGKLSLIESDPELVTLQLERLGRLSVDLERVSGITLGMAPGASSVRTETDDVVVYANGDRGLGFVLSIGGEVRLELQDSIRRTPIESVREVRLANPPESPRGVLVWLDDGSVVLASGFGAPAPDRVSITPARAPTDATAIASESAPADDESGYRLDQMAAVLFAAETFAPLSSLAVEPARASVSVDPSGPLIGPSALLFSSPIELPRPMRTRWVLPEGAERFAALASMPPTSMQWGDLELVIGVESATGAERELDRVTLNVDRPSAEIRVALPPDADALIVHVEAGAYGSVQDRVRLDRAFVTIDAREIDG
ncbi:MAG: hypothetical protein AAGK04_01065 [Planctomycetota bacterium]